jgi:pSer/pThr/pTyr-binding forkhead associated (FHA) protein
MGSLFMRFFIGGAAGLAAWAMIEPTNPGEYEQLSWTRFESRLILAIGALVGAAIGGYNGYLQGGRTHILRGIGLGLLAGLIAAPLGYSLGGYLSMLVGGVRREGSPLNPIARFLAFTPFGLFLGFAIGGSSWDWRRAVHGAIGGALAGAVAGLSFDAIGWALGGLVVNIKNAKPGEMVDTGELPRAMTALLMGALIGLFIGLVEMVAKSAWVRLALGRNEGREWPIFGNAAYIGRRENAQIPVFGDPGVAPDHAVIIKQGNDYVLQDRGSGMPTLLNGAPIQTASLASGSVIQVGNTRLEFLLKGRAISPAADLAGMRAGYPIGYTAPSQPQQGPYPGPTQAMPVHPTMAPMPPASSPLPPTMAMPPAGAPLQPTVAVPAAGAMGSALNMVAMDGPLAGQRVMLNQPMELGRESTVLPMAFDSSASRKHATIAPTPNGIVVNDLGSTNGTFVNGQRISAPTTIRQGDLVRIGATTFRIE